MYVASGIVVFDLHRKTIKWSQVGWGGGGGGGGVCGGGGACRGLHCTAWCGSGGPALDGPEAGGVRASRPTWRTPQCAAQPAGSAVLVQRQGAPTAASGLCSPVSPRPHLSRSLPSLSLPCLPAAPRPVHRLHPVQGIRLLWWAALPGWGLSDADGRTQPWQSSMQYRPRRSRLRCGLTRAQKCSPPPASPPVAGPLRPSTAPLLPTALPHCSPHPG